MWPQAAADSKSVDRRWVLTLAMVAWGCASPSVHSHEERDGLLDATNALASDAGFEVDAGEGGSATSDPLDGGTADGPDAMALDASAAADEGQIDAGSEVDTGTAVSGDSVDIDLIVDLVAPGDSALDTELTVDVYGDATADGGDSSMLLDGGDASGEGDTSEDTIAQPAACPEWAGTMDSPIAYAPCDPIVVTPETVDEVIPVPKACGVPVPNTAEFNAIYDLSEALYIYGFDGLDSYESYAGGIRLLTAREDGGAWVVLVRPIKSGFQFEYTAFPPLSTLIERVDVDGNVGASDVLTEGLSGYFLHWLSDVGDDDVLLYATIPPYFPSDGPLGGFYNGLFEIHEGQITWAGSLSATHKAAGTLHKGGGGVDHLTLPVISQRWAPRPRPSSLSTRALTSS
jgi:hypothetical protein